MHIRLLGIPNNNWLAGQRVIDHYLDHVIVLVCLRHIAAIVHCVDVASLSRIDTANRYKAVRISDHNSLDVICITGIRIGRYLPCQINIVNIRLAGRHRLFGIFDHKMTDFGLANAFAYSSYTASIAAVNTSVGTTIAYIQSVITFFPWLDDAIIDKIDLSAAVKRVGLLGCQRTAIDPYITKPSAKKNPLFGNPFSSCAE